MAQGRKAAFQSKPRKTSATPGSEERDINAAIVPDVKELNVHQAATQLALAIGGLIEEADYEYLTPRIEAVLGWTDELNRSDFRNIDRELSLLVGRAEELITQAEEWRTRFNEADHHVERDDDDVLEPEPVPSDPAHSELTAA